MRGYIPPLPNTPSWRGDRLKYRDNFTFTITNLDTRCRSVVRFTLSYHQL